MGARSAKTLDDMSDLEFHLGIRQVVASATGNFFSLKIARVKADFNLNYPDRSLTIATRA